MLQIETSILLLIDIQGRLASVMPDKERLFKHTQILIKSAKIFGIPILYTEQLPHKLGATVPEVAEHLRGISPIEKSSFSCCGNSNFVSALKDASRPQIVVAGIETHVCVSQTVEDLLADRYAVAVVADAVSSRTLENKTIALDRMAALGAVLVSTEMTVCEWLRTADHPRFREILGLIK